MSYEKSTDLIQVGLPVKQSFQQVLRIFSMYYGYMYELTIYMYVCMYVCLVRVIETQPFLKLQFAVETGREIKLEIEPGTFLVANCGALLSKVQDKVSTDTYSFLKLDSGMTEVLRPSL